MFVVVAGDGVGGGGDASCSVGGGGDASCSVGGGGDTPRRLPAHSTVHCRWDRHPTAFKAAGDVGTNGQLRPRVLVALQEEPQPRQGHSADGAARRVVHRVAAGSIQCFAWTRRAPKRIRAHTPASVEGHAVEEKEDSTARRCSLQLGAITPTRWAEWEVVIPARDLDDQLGSARLAVVRPCFLLGLRLVVRFATQDENGHLRGRRLTWKRKRVCRWVPDLLAVVRNERDDALESLVSQGR